jgi:uncharacterized protein YciU (UPF0263 family)
MSKYNSNKVYVIEQEGILNKFRKQEKAIAFCNEHNINPGDIIVFDSSKEERRWEELKIAEQCGSISDLQRQVPFLLIPAQYLEKVVTVRNKEKLKKYRAEAPITYKADFTYYQDGKLIVEDVKSEMTRHLPDYVMKRKLMLYIHGIKLKEVI